MAEEFKKTGLMDGMGENNDDDRVTLGLERQKFGTYRLDDERRTRNVFI